MIVATSRYAATISGRRMIVAFVVRRPCVRSYSMCESVFSVVISDDSKMKNNQNELNVIVYNGCLLSLVLSTHACGQHMNMKDLSA